jgi:signal transduction histidine kinase
VECSIPIGEENIYLEGTASPLRDPTGKIIASVAIIRDITERKRAEQEICRLNEELQKKIKELIKTQEELVRKEKLSILGQLAGIVGHELRNPLGVMNNAVYFLQTVMTDTADDTVTEYLNIIKQEINSSQQIIDDLLGFARTKTPQPRPIGILELIDGSLAKCTVPENISVEIDIPESIPTVNIDPFQIRQAFQNLITNAVQAMPEGGRLNIDAHLIQDSIEVSIKDTGVGIPPENLTKIFQPLFTTKTKGIGLGLVVCKNLVEANKGSIRVESEEGRGTVFVVVVPVVFCP